MDSTNVRTRTGIALLLLAAAALAASGGFAIAQSVAGSFLPHDVAWLGMTADDLRRFDGGRIVAFMFHDRVAFGGTLLAVAMLYAWLALGPLASGERWAWWTLVVSGAAGFLSFLAYLGTGYLDTWHGVATLLLLPVFLAGLVATAPTNQRRRPARRQWLVDPGARGNGSRLAGLALTILAGFGMVTAGSVILGVGATTVFVPQDLAFIGAQRCDIAAISDRLVPLIAHDRAGFGGGLLAAGIAATAIAVFAVPTPSRWRVLAGAGSLGFAAAIGVHVAIGYTDVTHLGPAVLGAAVLAAGPVLSAPDGQSSSWFTDAVGSPSAGRGSSPGP
jgi:hypothetical protein